MNFKRTLISLAITGAAAFAAPATIAGTEVWFTPLTASSYVAGAPDHPNELAQPWLAPQGITQKKLLSLKDVEADVTQSILRAPGAGSSASMFDMLTYDFNGRFLYLPHETPWGAGASRYDSWTKKTELLFEGDGNGAKEDWSGDYAAFDPATFTPIGTLFVAEEWSGEGRVIEITNPETADVDDIKIRELQSVPNVAHEGLRFSRLDNQTLYFVDEWNSGSIYKTVLPSSDYSVPGQTFVLVVDAYKGKAADNYNEASNAGQPRTGLATWVPITDKAGKPLTKADPFKNGPTDDPRTSTITRGGRPAADEVNGTPYGRPEDIEVGQLSNDHEVVYFAATSERTVYSIEILSPTKAMVRVFADDQKTPKNAGFAPTTAVMNSPDNLETDALGNIYIIEDAPNGDVIGGDVWFARDINNDGVAESIHHFLSLGVNGAEHTGMEFNPASPTRFVMSVQHPTSTDLDVAPKGQGDAVWEFDIAGVVPPRCETTYGVHPTTGQQIVVPKQPAATRTCDTHWEAQFIRRLQATVK